VLLERLRGLPNFGPETSSEAATGETEACLVGLYHMGRTEIRHGSGD